MAGTTGGDSQKQFLTLIRNFATEKSQGERRIVGLKKQIEEIRSELEAANAKALDAKRAKEIIEQELKAYEVELAMRETSIESLESRISLIHDEISSVGSVLDALRKEEGALRDQFISQMFELNANIRKFYKESSLDTVAEGEKFAVEEINEVASNTLEDKIAHVLSQAAVEEEEYQSEQNIQNQSQRELVDSERKLSLVEVIMKTSRALQDLTSQTSDIEQMCTSIGESLHRRCICPNCHLDNVEVLGNSLQPN